MGMTSAGSTTALLLLLLSAAVILNLSRAETAIPQQPLRVVVTFQEYSACDVGNTVFAPNATCASMAKCYGRRLILKLDGCKEEGYAFVQGDTVLLDAVKAWVEEQIHTETAHNVLMVELDAVFTSSIGNDTEVQAQYDESPTVQAQYDENSSSMPANNRQWNLEMVDAYRLWDEKGTYGEEYTVAVLDSGLAVTALDAFLDAYGGSRVVAGYDFVSDEGSSMDGDGRDADFYDPGDADADYCLGKGNSWHGTKVASVLGANYSGYLGVAPGVNVMPVRVLGRCGSGYASDVADAIVWAAGGVINGVEEVRDDGRKRVISMSFAGRGRCPSYMQTAVDLAVAKNVTLFAAAGNDPSLNAADHFPANCKGVVSVGALNWRKEVASYSSRGADVYMPGGDAEKAVECLGKDLDVEGCVGTSVAVPHAGGLTILLNSDTWQLWNWRQPWFNSTEWLKPVNYTSENVSIQEQTFTFTGFSGTYDLPWSIYGETYTFWIAPSGAAAFEYVNIVVKTGLGNALVYAGTCTAIESCPDGWNLLNGVSANDQFYQFLPSDSLVGSRAVVKVYLVASAADPVRFPLFMAWKGSVTASPAPTPTPSPTPVSCPAGQYSTGLSCVACPAGTYSATAGSTSCTRCPAGWFSSVPGSTTDANCQICPAGTYSASGDSACTACPAGTFSGTAGAANASFCQKCPAGTFSNVSSSTCTACPLGQYAFAGSAGCASSIMTVPAQMCLGAGASFTCVVGVAGELVCWGSNWAGQLFLGSTLDVGNSASEMGTNLKTANLGGNDRKAVKVACSAFAACVLMDDNKVACVGYNNNGQLGIGSTVNRGGLPEHMGNGLLTVDLGTNKPIADIRSNSLASFFCVLFQDNTSMKCWGVNQYGQLGINSTAKIGDGPGEMGANLKDVELGTSAPIKQFTVGVSHVCVLFVDGRVKCWGNNNYGQLGIGDIYPRGDGARGMGTLLLFVNLGTSRTAKMISAGEEHTCALLDNGSVKCWGGNRVGQLGLLLTTTDSRGDVPNEMGDLLPAVSLGTGVVPDLIFSSRTANCIVDTRGRVKCWGQNYNGNLGIGDTVDRGASGTLMGDGLPFVDLGTNKAARSLSMNFGRTCAILNDSTVKCWGDAQFMGYGDSNNRGDAPGEMGNALPTIALSGFVCQQCSPGSYVISNCISCGTCPAGSFSSSVNSLQCSTCPAGSYSPSGSSSCTQCPAGTYSALSNSSSCTSCPANTFSPMLGATSLLQCLPATSALKGPRKYPPAALGLGNAAQTVTLTGLSFGNGVYTVAWSSAQGGTDRLPKVIFDNNTATWGVWSPSSYNTANGVYIGAADLNNDGYKGDWLTLRIPVNLILTSISMTAIESYETYAPRNYRVYAKTDAMTSWVVLADVTNAAYVNRVHTNSSMNSNSVAYNNFAFEVPLLSGVGTNSLGLSEAGFFGMEIEQCAAGSYLFGSSACMLCPAGTSSASTNATSNATCTKCPAGTIANTSGSSSCTQCPAGYYANADATQCLICPTGSYSPSLSTSCTPCPSGQYANVSGTANNCTPCPPGLYSPSGGVNCALCEAGTYVSTSGASKCDPCPAGTFANNLGFALCTPCALGTFSNATGATAISTCKPCPPGTFANVTGSTRCQPCSTGQYATQFSSSQCVKCSAGTVTGA